MSLAFTHIRQLLFTFLWRHHHEKSTKTTIARRASHWIDPVDPWYYQERSNATLQARDEFECNAKKPCGNGACCGGSGYCGYGPTYCGSKCVSNCDAVAECGKYAKTPGTTCPLNTCCSKFGFCGTITDFCKGMTILWRSTLPVPKTTADGSFAAGCQSNCILKPEPPGGNSSGSILQSRVIGYYEVSNLQMDNLP
jgi:chitinase